MKSKKKETEYVCPVMREEKIKDPVVDLDYCESMTLGHGCPEMLSCDAYQKAKKE